MIAIDIADSPVMRIGSPTPIRQPTCVVPIYPELYKHGDMAFYLLAWILHKYHKAGIGVLIHVKRPLIRNCIIRSYFYYRVSPCTAGILLGISNH
jgi:hypothetical protein